MTLNKEDLHLILESLNYTKLKFENYDSYPSYEFKQEQLKQVNDLIKKVNVVVEMSLE